MKLTTIFCVIDDFCKDFEKETEKYFLIDLQRRRRKRKSRLSKSEVLTILIYFHHSHYRTFKEYYNVHIRFFLKDAFGSLVSYNRFIELAQKVALPLLVFSYAFNVQEDNIYFIDSFVLRACNNKRIYSHQVLKGVAARGKSSMGWFFGLKFHFIVNSYGEMVNFLLTPGNISDKNKRVVNFLTAGCSGRLFGDKGYISSLLFKDLFNKGLKIVTGIRKNMKNRLMDLTDKLLLRRRGVIESVGNIMKNFHQIEHSRHRSVLGFLINAFSAVSAYHLKSQKPSIYLKNATYLPS